MERDAPDTGTEGELWRLERRIDDLIDLCDRLRKENRALRAQQERLAGERADLLERSTAVQGRIEAMMARLRGIEESPEQLA